MRDYLWIVGIILVHMYLWYFNIFDKFFGLFSTKMIKLKISLFYISLAFDATQVF